MKIEFTIETEERGFGFVITSVGMAVLFWKWTVGIDWK